MKKGGKSDRNIPYCTGKEQFEKKIPLEMEVRGAVKNVLADFVR